MKDIKYLKKENITRRKEKRIVMGSALSWEVLGPHMCHRHHLMPFLSLAIGLDWLMDL